MSPVFEKASGTFKSPKSEKIGDKYAFDYQGLLALLVSRFLGYQRYFAKYIVFEAYYPN
jgi:hypothetical protein